ncbi:hypothetical protein V1515DRAFT_589676 [Lipomyces mesembrius]
MYVVSAQLKTSCDSVVPARQLWQRCFDRGSSIPCSWHWNSRLYYKADTPGYVQADLKSCAVSERLKPEEREQCKQWIEDTSCAAWTDGWCIIDGTLVPIFSKSQYYEDVFYDGKSNYSFNVPAMS